MFRQKSTMVIGEHKEAVQLLLEMKEEFTQANFSLQNSSLTTVDSLLEVINGTKPADEKSIRNAAFLDDSAKGNPIVSALIKMGIPHTEKDIEFIQYGNKEAAELLRNRPVVSSIGGSRAF